MLKTRRMQQIEQRMGRPIEVLLADLYVAQGLNINAVGERLGIHYTLVPRYLRLCGLPVRAPNVTRAGAGWGKGTNHGAK